MLGADVARQAANPAERAGRDDHKKADGGDGEAEDDQQFAHAATVAKSRDDRVPPALQLAATSARPSRARKFKSKAAAMIAPAQNAQMLRWPESIKAPAMAGPMICATDRSD